MRRRSTSARRTLRPRFATGWSVWPRFRIRNFIGHKPCDFPRMTSRESSHAPTIYIGKENLAPALRNRLVCLAAFQNPEFYRAQAMRLSTYDKPRIVACAEDLHRQGEPCARASQPVGLSGRVSESGILSGTSHATFHV